MRLFRGLSARIWLSIFVLMVGYLVSLGFSYRSSLAIQRELPNISDFGVTSTALGQQIVTTFDAQTKAYNDAVMIGEPELIEKAEKSAAGVRSFLGELKSLPGISEGIGRMIDDILSHLSDFTADAGAVYGRMSRGETGEEIVREAGRLDRKKVNIMEAMKALNHALRTDLSNNITAVVTEAGRRNLINIVISLLIILGTGTAIGIVVRRSVTGVLGRINHGIGASSRTVSQASGQLQAKGEQLAAGAGRQAGSIQRITAGMKEIVSMVRQTHEITQEAQRTGNEARGYLETAEASMEETIEAMKRVKAGSDDIERIIESVEGIAFQIKLLSLNASVEAARAGDAGAGFAVVANEVRDLALRTGRSAQETRSIIKRTVGEIDQGVRFLERTRRDFGEAARQNRDVVERVGGISAASERQSEEAARVSEAMEEVNRVTQHNASEADDTAMLAKALGEQSRILLRLARRLSTLLKGRSRGGGVEIPSGREASPETAPPTWKKLAGKGDILSSLRDRANGFGAGGLEKVIPMDRYRAEK